MILRLNKKIRKIERPALASAVRLTAPELNGIHFSTRHTVLTSEVLAKYAGRGKKDR